MATFAVAEPIVDLPSNVRQPINAIRKIFHQIPRASKKRAALGLDPVINLSIGQPHIPPDMRAFDAFIRYLESLKEMSNEQLCAEMGYSHSAGIPEARRWISRFYTESYPEVIEGFTPDEVMVASGGTGAMTNALRVLISEGGEVAVFAPYFAAYENQVKSCGGKIVPVSPVPGRSKADLLEETLGSYPQVKVWIWNDPNNPLGTRATEKELREKARTLQNHLHLILIHDEVYREIIHSGAPLSLLNVAPELKERSFVIRSLAKEILGAPGVRAGMISAPTRMLTRDGDRVNFIELMSGEQLRDITSLEQKLTGASAAWEESMKKEYAENIGAAVALLTQLGLPPLSPPNGACYVMADVSSLLGKNIPDEIGAIDRMHQKIGNQIQNDLDVALFFLHVAGVAVVPRIGTGANRPSIRISCARPKGEIAEAMERIKNLLKLP